MKNKIECEKAVGEICEMCFKKHELEYGNQPDTCAFWAFDNEDCPTVKVLKDLIQEHFEEKKESNLEHYKEEIKSAGYEFALVNGKPTTCKWILCDQCFFNDKSLCAKKRIEWMLKPFKRKYKLTQFEFDLLNAHKDSGMQKCLSNYRPLLELNEKGYFKDIDTKIPIREILDNCKVV